MADAPREAAPLTPASDDEVSQILAYALRHDDRGKPRRGAAWEAAAGALADQIAGQMRRANLVVMKRPPRTPHST